MSVNAAGAVEIRRALVRLRRTTGLPVAFGGLVESDRSRMRISELSGTATTSLLALAVNSGNGLGGKAVALARPCAVADYSLSRQISHEYDAAVATEGLRSVLAVPVVVRRRVRGVLYGALRDARPLGDRMLTAAVDAARDVEQALVVGDEAREVLMAARAEPVRGDASTWEQVREAHAALRALAPRIGDPALRAELLDACALLTTDRAPSVPSAHSAHSAHSAPSGTAAPSGPSALSKRVALAPRELDVLACVAAGATNAAAADRLGVTAETVKAYLRSAMRKLGSSTRGEAVVAARRAGLLP